MDTLLELFGWYGTVAIVGAYLLNSFGYMQAHRLSYQLLNATGALGVAVVSYHKKAWQPMSLNVIWFVIGIIATARLFI